jgi:hypothetical protein
MTNIDVQELAPAFKPFASKFIEHGIDGIALRAISTDSETGSPKMDVCWNALKELNPGLSLIQCKILATKLVALLNNGR